MRVLILLFIVSLSMNSIAGESSPAIKDTTGSWSLQDTAVGVFLVNDTSGRVYQVYKDQYGDTVAEAITFIEERNNFTDPKRGVVGTLHLSRPKWLNDELTPLVKEECPAKDFLDGKCK